ncbi:MAG: ATP-binding protein [Acidobacteriota bacterium]|nr:ATP-binding protein [Acidobacteriota bacterium]
MLDAESIAFLRIKKHFEAFMQTSMEAIFCYEVDPPIPLDQPEADVIDQFMERSVMVLANDVYGKLAGFERGSDLLGLPLNRMISFSDPDNYESVLDLVRNGFRARDRLTVEEYPNVGKIYLLNNAYGVIEDDCLVGIWGTARDITAQKKAEQTADEQREVINRMNRIDSLGEMAGSIAHELNQPLTGIICNSHAVKLMGEKGIVIPDEVLEIIDDIIADVKRADQIIANLGALFTATPPDTMPLDLNMIVKETLALMNSQLITHRITADAALCERGAFILGNKIQCQQILINLITNAVHALEDQSGEKHLTVRTGRENNRVLLQVEDNGPGFSQSPIEQALEPLVTSRPDGSGMGMGLSICRNIVAAHRGLISLHNRDAGGARVTVKFLAEKPTSYKNG